MRGEICLRTAKKILIMKEYDSSQAEANEFTEHNLSVRKWTDENLVYDEMEFLIDKGNGVIR